MLPAGHGRSPIVRRPGAGRRDFVGRNVAERLGRICKRGRTVHGRAIVSRGPPGAPAVPAPNQATLAPALYSGPSAPPTATQQDADVAFFTEFERFDRHLEKLNRGPREGRVQYVSICSPNHLHDAHVRLALRTGAEAICEKPLVLNPWNLDALAELEAETKRRVHTVLQLRLHPALLAVKDSEPATQSIGLSVVAIKLLAFAMSGFGARRSSTPGSCPSGWAMTSAPPSCSVRPSRVATGSRTRP